MMLAKLLLAVCACVLASFFGWCFKKYDSLSHIKIKALQAKNIIFVK